MEAVRHVGYRFRCIFDAVGRAVFISTFRFSAIENFPHIILIHYFRGLFEEYAHSITILHFLHFFTAKIPVFVI